MDKIRAKLTSIYLSVKDMDRAVGFYEELLGQGVSSKESRMSEFDLGGISLLLYDPKEDGEKVQAGNNVMPCFEVDDLEEAYSYITDQGLKIVLDLEEVGKFILFQSKDTEGNTIEIYAKNN